ncbi:MAG: hypothetical protein ACTHN0_16835 [Aquihabitans sp.]
MTRLEDAFDQLIAPHPEGDPDAILAAARAQAAASRSHRRTRYGLAAAAVVLVLAALVGTTIATRDDPDDHLRTGPTGAATTSSTRPATTTTTAPFAAPGTGHAVASVLGVTLRMGTGVNTGVGLTRDPAASAYAIGTDLVVFQLTDPDVDTIAPPVPPVPSGDIELWARNEGITPLIVDRDAIDAVLLDADRIDGSPQALVALRRGNTPDTARERLVLVDLTTRKVREIVDVAAWEGGHTQARLLPDGDVVGVISGEGQTSLVRWTAASDEPVWSTPIPSSRMAAIAVRGDRAVLVDNARTAGARTQVRPIDLATGALGASTSFAGSTGAPWCTDWYDADELSCTDRYGSAGAVDQQGRWRSLQTPTGAVVTTSR